MYWGVMLWYIHYTCLTGEEEMALRLVGKNTKRVQIGDEDFIEVLNDIPRRQFNDIVRTIPRDTDNLTLDSTEEFIVTLFNSFVKGWSVADDSGQPVPVSEENYYQLSREASGLIDAAVLEHFNSLTPSPQEQTKSAEQRTELQREEVSGTVPGDSGSV
jgi:hypothetical protein